MQQKASRQHGKQGKRSWKNKYIMQLVIYRYNKKNKALRSKLPVVGGLLRTFDERKPNPGIVV